MFTFANTTGSNIAGAASEPAGALHAHPAPMQKLMHVDLGALLDDGKYDGVPHRQVARE